MKWLLSLLALLVALAVTGCPPCNPGQPEIFYEDFESWCGELPCDWTLEAGLARKVSTYHTGEHAVELSDGARLVLVPDDLHLAATLDSESVALMLICDPGAGLVFELVVEQEGVEFSLWTEWPVGLAFVDDFIEMWIFGFTARELDPPEAPAVLRLIVEQVGDGACVVDTLRILSGEWIQCMG